MVFAFLLLLVLAIAAGVAFARPRDASPGPAPLDPPVDDRSPTELAATDPLAALHLYGTPDDASRLAGEGVDLGSLGHRPPADE